MRNDIVGQADEFVSKVAGTLPAQKFTKQIYNIIGMIRDFMMSKKFYDLRAGARLKLGSVPIEAAGKQITLDIMVVLDEYLSFNAGMDWSQKNPILVVNLHTLRYYDPLFIDNKLKPLIYHELTHFLDNAYNPAYSHAFEEGELDSEFIKAYKRLLIKNSPQIDYGDLSSFKGHSIETRARHNALRLFKTRAFKELVAKHNVTLDEAMIGKLIRISYDLNLEDMNFFRDTGGFPFIQPQSAEDKKKYKRIKDTASHLYFNSDAEVKAYTNQIISEVYDFLNRDADQLIIKFMRGHERISDHLEYLLGKSKTFVENKDEWNDQSLMKIYKELANFLTKQSKTFSNTERAELQDIPFNSRQDLVYRYLKKLLNTNPEKLNKLIKDEKFKDKNEAALRLLLKDLEFVQSVKKLRESIPSSLKEKV
jgi:hypothetical protein